MNPIMHASKNLALLCQLSRFGIVGVLAACVHMAIVIVLVEQKLLMPLVANILAFACAFNVSYFGHRYFTFKHVTVDFKKSWLRFLLIATSSFLLNESLFYVLMRFFYYPIALAMAIFLVAIVTFISSKIWAFVDE